MDDLILGGYQGLPYLASGAQHGWHSPVPLTDRYHHLMHAGQYWNPHTRRHEGVDGGFEARAIAALPLDWDSDGDFDLVVGTYQGDLLLRRNEGSAKKYQFSPEAERIEVAPGVAAHVPSGYAMPIAVDWDQDGRTDLLSGSKDGAAYWFQNRGPAWSLSPPVQVLSAASQGSPGPASHSQVATGDLDGDGRFELLVGDRSVANRQSHGTIWWYRIRQKSKVRLNTRPDAITASKFGSHR